MFYTSLLIFALGVSLNSNALDINYQLTQPQILIEDGNIHIVPARDRNIVLLSNGDGKIKFNSVEMNSLVSSIQNSSRELASFQRIFGSPSNASSALPQRLISLEQAVREMRPIVDNLVTRLDDVQRTLIYNTSSTNSSTSRSLLNRLRRLNSRMTAVEAQLRSEGAGGGPNPCAGSSSPCNGGSCIPTPYGPYCLCPPGWEGPTCTQDVNECANFAGTDLGCQNQATCINRQGSYECQCRAGWIGVHCTKRAGDCSTGSDAELCGHGFCIDQKSGARPFTCICEQGWRTDGASTSPACTQDVNECESGPPHCSQNPPVLCINTPGSYVCGPCPLGYTGNGHRCTDVNECLVGNGGCSMNPMVPCINTIGSRSCGECPPGFVGNGVSCQYVGLCAVNNGGCNGMARCIENPAIGQSFVQCLCPAGFTGTGLGPNGCYPSSGGGGGGIAIPSNPCASGNPCQNGGICRPFGDSFSCLCLNGYTGPTCNQIGNPCLSLPCQNGGQCTQTGATYSCRCTSDFTGNNCERQVESCGGTFSTPQGTLTYPHDTTQEYQNNINCVWIITTTAGKVLNVSFTRFHLENVGRCYADSLSIRDGGTMSAPILGRYCGDTGPSIISTHNALHLTFTSDHSIVGLGFELVWNTTEPVCGGYISNLTHGSINSPGYPGDYPHDRDCEWQIEVSPGKRIQLVFATFRIEAHANCSFDYLQVRDGLADNAPILAYYCNSTLPPPITSSGPYLSIRFHSDNSATDSGFHITFAEVPGIPGCGGVLTNPSGSFSSPSHPEPYEHGLECDWIIRLPSGTDRIALSFNTFEIEGGSTCRYDYVEVRDGPSPGSPLVGRFCGSTPPPKFSSSGSQLFVRFKSDESVAFGGFSAKYEAVCGGVFTAAQGLLRSPFYPNVYPKNRECIFLISVPPGKGILLDFLDFDIEGGLDTRCYFDYLEIRDGDTENSTLIGHYCGPPEATPERILSTHNYIWIKFKTDGSVQNKGFMANYTTYDTGCGGIIREPHGIISSPGHPEVYPHGVSCTWVLRGSPSQVVRLTWISFSLEAGTTCLYDYVQVFDNSTIFRNGTSMGRFCGHTIPPVLTSSENTMTIQFKSDHSVAHDGFQASFILLNTSSVCGGEYYTEYGVIRSPAYPQPYGARKSCVWTIRVPTGRQIRLNISDFELENGSGSRCNYDYLEIRNGGYSNSPLIGKYCGNVRPPPIIPSFSNTLYLKFVSDASAAGRGFFITWDGTTTGCGGRISSPTGSITSPNYPLAYGSRTECIWTIVVNQGSSIQLTFVDLDIQSTSTCYNEYIEIRDGGDRNAPLLGKYCHSDAVLTVNSTGSMVHVKFLSGYGGSGGRGFQLNYRASCNRVITGFHGVIESPNFPNPYPHNRNCTWEIQAPRGNKVNVSFSHFDVEAPRRDSCVYDFVELKEWSRFSRQTGGPDGKTSLGKYCGDARPPLATSTKDTLSINFISDHSYALNGFRLEWRVHGCGGRLFSSYNNLASPNYPRKYGNNVECLWHITTELGTKVELTIYELDIERAENCAWDGLQVYGGSDERAPLLTTLCHSTTSSTTITSHGNNMYVRFYSDGSVPSKGFHGAAYAVPGGCGGHIQAPSGFIYSPNYPGNYDHNDDCGWLISVERNHVVSLQFMDFSVERHINCSYDHVAVYDGSSEDDPILLFHCGSTIPEPNLVSSSGNQMYVRLKTDGSSASRGFKANFTQGCGARISGGGNAYWNREISSPHYPSRIVSPTNCTWILAAPEPGDHVSLTFTSMDLLPAEEGLEPCSNNFVEVLDGEDAEAPSLGKFCRHAVPPSFTSTGSALLVRFQTGAFPGNGFRAVYDFSSSACGFTNVLTSDSGSFTSPNYPNGYPPNMDCVWMITAPAGNKVEVSFRRFELESSDSCNLDFLEIHEESPEGPLLGHYCGAGDLPSNLSASNALWILFRSDGEGTGPGFWADYNLVHGVELNGSYGVIESPGYPIMNSLTGTYSWRVNVNESQAIEITFDVVDFIHDSMDGLGDCSRYNRITIFDGYDETAGILSQTCAGSSIPPITTSGPTAFIQFVKPFAWSKWRLSWQEIQPSSGAVGLPNITGCGGNFSLSEGNISSLLSPNYPSNYPDNVRCVWTFNSPVHTRIKLQIEELEMESNVNCQYDKVDIYDGRLGLPQYRLNKTICHRDQVNGTLVSSGRFLQIIMTTDASYTRSGFNLSLSVVCGGYSREPRGKITSPGYPGNYAPSNCDWSVIVRPGRSIRAYFERFDIYSDASGCGTDELILRDGGSTESPFLGTGRYCGATIPTLPETSGNQLHVTFRSWTSSRRGFALIYEEQGGGCGGEIFLTQAAPRSTINSPNFPNIPSPFTECEWFISVPQGDSVQLTFQISFEFDDSGIACEGEGVELRDGGTQLSPLIGRTFCKTMPSTQKSTGNIMYVRYYTNVQEPRTGFKAEVAIATCGGLLTGWSGTIKSPGYPTSYDINLDCLWTIKTPESTTITLRFAEVELGSRRIPPQTNGTEESYCPDDKDRIVIREPDNGDLVPRNWTICERSQYYMLQTGVNQLTLRFISDGVRETKKGFSISFNAVQEPCGGVHRSPTGILQTPNYPNPYPHYRHCTWRIVAPPERRVRLEFLDFDLEETYTANGKRYCYDAVSLFQGYWRDISRLYNRTLCGAVLPPPVETTQNELSIYFNSDNSVSHRGFKARYTTSLPALCGGSLPAWNGSVASPNLTSGTPNTTTNGLCVWTSSPESSSSRNGTTVITIEFLRIPPWGGGNDALCPYGFLKFTPFLLDGSYNYRKYCGALENIKLYLPGPAFSVEYETGFIESNFSFSYRVMRCGDFLSGPTDNISSIGWESGSGYPASTECIWTLEYEPGSQIRVTFLSMDLDDHGSSSVCDRDYVLIRNGKYQTSPILGKYCGSQIPPDLISMSSHLWIEFHSDENTDGGRRGFSISTESISRGCGGVLHRKYGKLSSPSVGGSTYRVNTGTSRRYPPNTECEWVIETVPGYMLNLRFEGRFDIEQTSNCTNDYVELFTKFESESEETSEWVSLGRFCGRSLPPQINTTSPSAKVKFVSNGNVDGNGFSLIWYSPCGGVFTQKSGTIRSAHYDRLNHSKSLNTENYWGYVGWEAVWETTNCRYLVQAQPEDYVVLEFLPPFDISVPASYGVRRSEVLSECPEVNLTVWEGNGSDPTGARRAGSVYCGNNVPPAWVAKGSATLSYNYRPEYQNLGFRAKYSVYECGGLISSPTSISSPGHPFTHAPHMSCIWNITAPTPALVPRFKFQSMELEFHGRCAFDFVKIFDGREMREERLLGTFCGNLTEDMHPIVGRSTDMILQFSTDWVVEQGGFRGVLDFTPGEAQGCGGQKNVSDGGGITIQSVDSNGDGLYEGDLDCQWMVGGLDEQALQLTFERFQLEGGRRSGKGGGGGEDECPFDYIEIRDGPGPFSQLLGKFCGSTPPPPVLSSNNIMWIRFVSDSSYGYSGFRARIINRPSPCGGTFVLNATKEGVGVLTSPSYPAPYSPNTRCKWTIDGEGFFDEVDLKFIDLDTEPSGGCAGDRLEIKDVSSSYTSPEGISGPILFIGNGPVDWRHRNLDLGSEILQDVRYCGSQTPPDFFSVGRSAELVFHSDSSPNPSRRGFKLEYRAAGCNRSYEGAQGRIFSPEYPNYSPIFLNCLWSIRGGNGSSISLYFNMFMLPGASECSQSSMEVRDGSPGGPLLGKFCGSSRPNPIFSSGNALWVKYFTRVELSRGYDISYTTTREGRGCGGDLFHTGGSFTSPLYPGNFSQESDCRWRVRVPGGLVVVLEFTEFLVGGDCATDFLEILSLDPHRPEVAGVLFSRFCPGDTISTYTGSTEAAEVRYKTSRNNSGAGWRVEFKGISPSRLSQ